MQCPNPPNFIFSVRCPTHAEICKSIRRKRNGSSPGLNAITYVPYKKCKSLQKFVVKFARKIWRKKDIPADWAQAFIVLLSKSQDLATVSEFRPIAITCTVGKIFFSVVADRLQLFMLKNNFISREIQKGFLAGVPGCIEHTFALFEALRDSKQHYRQLVITWIDLANAYGSVRHNLIQFALEWYHVPKMIQMLIFNYYEQLCAAVFTNKWSTGFFLFDIGLFQGCVLSTILFDCVFQLLLDFLKPMDLLGYEYKIAPSVKTLKKAYADDLTLLTRNPKDNQTVLDSTNKWLKWSQTMKAKPSKCVAIGFKLFNKNSKTEKFIPLTKTSFAPFDPCLNIDGQPIRYIVNPQEKDPFKAEHFKFLGRWTHPLVKEKHVKIKLELGLKEDIQTIDDSKVNGLMKLWLYQFYALQHLSWPFIVNDLNRSFALELQRVTNPKLKKWARISRSIDNGILFRQKQNFGLGLTSISDHYERMQVVKCELLSHSKDPNIVALYKTRESLNAKLTRVWKATNATMEANAEVNLNLKFPSQSNRQGIGFGKFNPNPSLAEKRKLITSKTASFTEQKRIAHSASLKQQGAWLQWSENALPFDMSWNNLIWGGVSPLITKFVLESSVNWVRTPNLLKLWGLKNTSSCCLCGAPICSLHHILSNCSVALNGERYTWRHDSVLSEVQKAIHRHVEDRNANVVKDSFPHISSCFVPAGKSVVTPKKNPTCSGLISGTNDWKLLVDLPGSNYVFPPEILATLE